MHLHCCTCCLLAAVLAAGVPWLALAVPPAGSAAPPNAAATSRQQGECAWGQYLTHDVVTSWEFQLDVPLARVQAAVNRSDFLRAALGALHGAADRSGAQLQLDGPSLRTSVLLQTSHALSTADGRPLFPGARQQHFDWQEIGFIKLRHKLAMHTGAPDNHTTGAGREHGGGAGVRPGEAGGEADTCLWGFCLCDCCWSTPLPASMVSSLSAAT